MAPIIFEDIENKIFNIAGQPAIIDSDVAVLYGVETKRVNEAVKNNPEKFPDGYVIVLSKKQWDFLKSNFSTSKKGGKVKTPKAFTEKGLYMLATILKSEKATRTTIGIIETFDKFRKLTGYLSRVPKLADEDERSRVLSESGKILSEIFNDNLSIEGTETSIELNFAVLKIKHKINRK